MAKRSAQNLHRYSIAIPALVVLFCVLVVYAINSIYPFGTESIVHDDMGQCNVPMLYSVWDTLHGNGSILLNLRTAGGVFISGAYENLLSPVNILLFLICPRNSILHMMSFFLLIKMMLAASTAMLLFTRRFSLSVGWNVVLSVLYAFNPFILQYYSNASWLEIVWVAPLVFLGADLLLRGKKTILYILSLAYCLIVQLYIGYMVLLFLFLNGALYIALLLPKADRKRAAIRFGVSTVIAACLSAFSALPSFFYMTSTSRFQTTRSYLQILGTSATNPVTKLGMVIIMTALPLALSLICLIRIRKEKKIFLYLLANLLLFMIPVMFENVNLMWHMGSYVSFSMRYAFLFHLDLLLIAGFGLDRFADKLFRGRTITFVLTTCAVVGLMIGVCFMMHGYYTGTNKGMIFDAVMLRFFAIFLLLFVIYMLLLLFGHKKISCALLGACLLWEIGAYMNRSVTSGSSGTYEYSLEYISECDEIYRTLPLERDGLTRIKNIDGTLNSNYPLIVDYPAMSNFTHTIPSTIKASMKQLGYSTVYTRVLDTGGTLFTDTLLGYRYAMSLTPLSDENYELIGSAGSYQIYRTRYDTPFGTVCSGAITDENFFQKTSIASINKLWHTVTNEEQDLLEVPQITENKDERSATYDFDVTGTKELYIVCSGSSKRKNMQITVNGKVLPIPSLGEPENMRYTTRFQNNLLDLGTFSDMHVTIRVTLLNNTITMQKLNTQIALLDKRLLSDYCDSALHSNLRVQAKNRTITASVTENTESSFLFLPITYDSGWSCKVNGAAVKPVKALGTFMAIPLEKGQNDVRMSYLPKGFVVGVMISIVAAFAAALWFRKGDPFAEYLSRKKIAAVIWCGYFIADCCCFLALYIFPMVCKLYLFFTTG